MRFRLSAEADENLDSIAEQGIKLFGYAQAKRYIHEIKAIFALLAANPHMARERHEISPPVRVHPHKAHLIIYRIEENGDVLILALRNAHADWTSESIQ
ncbi:plasmid stabilization protein ParE [Brucella endophytica]|uniref:Plasmid stabilization protein ParE n=1 Tax=Brucella endophytica TaxID=1963359 RepID=A0A916SEG9_9HYPH|nr:type II toxin-antitoxin system RelE/ParE family toxin [Brucella endophytica]GGA96908.1 plasmid stabilization protein ParE [Brucella endophytica]